MYGVYGVPKLAQEFGEQIGKLPEKGMEIIRSLSQHLSPRDWDLSERAMHALQNIASAPGAAHAFEACLFVKLLQMYK